MASMTAPQKGSLSKSPSNVKGGLIALNDNMTLGLFVAILLATGVVVTAAQSQPPPAATGATFTFTGASETFIVPQRVKLLLVEVWGAGGGGGGAVAGFDGQGGGGGGYARSLISVPAGGEFTITVGGGGGAGPVGTGGFGLSGIEGQDGQGGAGGGGGGTLFAGPFVSLQGCGGGGGGFNVGGPFGGAITGGGRGGGGSICSGDAGQGGTGSLGGPDPGEGSILRGSAGRFFTPGLGAHGGGAFRSVASGGFGFNHEQPTPAGDGKPGLVRITYY